MAMGGIRFPAMRNWKLIVSVALPLLLLPIALLGESETDSKRYACAYTIILMGIFWMLEVLPLSVTAFFPIVLFPLFGIQSTGDVVANYMKETQMMFIGGICLALALQYCGLHKRIALRIMILIGCGPWRLLLGILVTTTLLSCVIVVNTAVAAMMLPIVIGLIESLESTSLGESRRKKLQTMFLLAVCYGANIGGTATIIGSGTALIYKELIEKENVGQDGKYMDLNFFTYSAFSFPLTAINVIIIWLVLGYTHLGFRQDPNSSDVETGSEDGMPKDSDSRNSLCSLALAEETAMGKKLKVKYDELGQMGFHEWGVLTLLSLAVLLWFTRDPQIFPGWDSFFPETVTIGDSTVGIGILLLMFIIPQDIKYFRRSYEGEGKTLLTWQYVNQHFPWNVLFILGGGMAISDGSDASGLSDWLGQKMMGLQDLPRPLILLVLVITISVFTEFMSNTATVSLLTPILITLSRQLDIHPLYLTLPGAIACQYAFVLPTSNPPNAIVFSAGEMRIVDMAKTGVILNFACISVLYVMNLTWGDYVLFGYRDYVYLNDTVTEIPSF